MSVVFGFVGFKSRNVKMLDILVLIHLIKVLRLSLLEVLSWQTHLAQTKEGQVLFVSIR